MIGWAGLLPKGIFAPFYAREWEHHLARRAASPDGVDRFEALVDLRILARIYGVRPDDGGPVRIGDWTPQKLATRWGWAGRAGRMRADRVLKNTRAWQDALLVQNLDQGGDGRPGTENGRRRR